MRRDLIICILIAIATIIAYGQLRDADFVNYDDPDYATANEYVLNGLTIDGLVWAFKSGLASNWHPLTWLSHMLDGQLYGANPAGHHLSNLLLHVLNTLLLFGLLKSMTRAVWLSAFVAAMFALHPLHVESVAWVSERKDLLSMFFGLLSMWAYAAYAKKAVISRYLLVVIFFAMALMAKPMLVTLPAILLLLDYWPLNRIRGSRSNNQGNRKPAGKMVSNEFICPERSVVYLLVEKIPLFMLSIASSIVTFLVQQKTGAMSTVEMIPLKLRIANAVVSYVRYLGKMFWPRGLAVLYPHPNTVGGTPWAVWQIAGAVLLLVVVSVIFVLLAKQKRFAIVGWLLYLGTLVPVIGIVQVGIQAMADRYTYLPSIGIFIIIAWGACELCVRWRLRKTWLAIPACIAIVSMTVCTWKQVQHWQNNFTLYNHALAVTENNHTVYNNMGIAYESEGRYDEAITYFQHALEITPNNADTYNNLGSSFAILNQPDKAVEYFLRALEIKPDYAEVHYNLGLLFSSRGEFDEAIGHLENGLEIASDNPTAHNNLGFAYQSVGRLDDAIGCYRHALEIEPDYAKARSNLATSLQIQGKDTEAMSHYRRVLERNPDQPMLLTKMAKILATHTDPKVRDSTLAIEYASRAAELTGHSNSAILNALAACYATAGQFEDAAAATEAAIKAGSSTDKVDRMREQLQIYKQQVSETKEVRQDVP